MTRIGSIGAAFVLGTILGIVLGSSLLCETPSEEMSVADSTNSRTPLATPTQVAGILPAEIHSPFRFDADPTAAAPEDTAVPGPTLPRSERELVDSAIPTEAIGAIQGRITDAQGAPISGATVRARWIGPVYEDRVLPKSTRGLAAPAIGDFEGAMAAARESFLSERSSTFEGVTDAGGRYHLSVTRAGDYDVDAWLEGRVLRAYPTSQTQVPSNNDVNFVASLAVELPIVVRRPDGGLAEQARLSFESLLHSDWVEDTWTPSTPTLRVSKDCYRIRARAKSRSASEDGSEIEFRSEPVVIDLSAHSTSAPLELSLVPTLGIRGYVRFPISMDHEYAIVRAVMVAPGCEVDREALLEADDETWVGFHYPQYSFEDLEPGRYCIAVFLDGVESPLSEAYVEVADGMEELDFDLADIATRGSMRTITATVLSPNQERVSRVDLQIAFVAPDGSVSEVRDVDELSGPNGEIDVLVDESLAKALDDLVSGTRASLVASNSYFGSTRVEIDRTTRHVELRFGDPADLEVRIASSWPNGIATHLRVALTAVDPLLGTVEDRSYSTRADGTTLFSGLGPGEYLVAVHSSGSGGGPDRKLLEQRVTLSAGSNRVVVSLPTLATLTIQVPGVESGSVMLHSELVGDVEAELTAGTARVEELPPGRYAIRYEGELGERRMEIDLGDSLTVTLPEPVQTESP